MGIPSTYKDIFWLLEKGKIIDKKEKEKIWSIAKYRNILAHEYGEITQKDVLYIIQNIGFLKKFADKIKSLLV